MRLTNNEENQSRRHHTKNKKRANGDGQATLQDKMATDGQKDFLTGYQGLGERTKADPEYNERMTFANSGPKNLALSGEEKATTEPNGGPMLRPSPCSGPIQADYDYDYDCT